MTGSRVMLSDASFAPSDRAAPVLEEVEAVAEGGRITVVVGANAAGKTTLLRTVAGLRPARAGRVSIELDGAAYDPWRMPARVRAGRIAMLTQRVGLPAGFGVAESVEMGRHARPHRPERILEAMDRLALDPLRDRAVETLSVGQQQRVGLARVIAQHEPGGILLLDEPFAPLDLRETARAAGVLREAARRGGVVIATVHDLGLAARFGDDVWLLDGGRLVASGPAGKVLNRSRLELLFGPEAMALAGLDDPREGPSRIDGSSGPT